jgi:hypothetical protein
VSDMYKAMTPEVAKEVLELFLGQNLSINHIVYTLNYDYRIDEITDVIREELRKHVTPG